LPEGTATRSCVGERLAGCIGEQRSRAPPGTMARGALLLAMTALLSCPTVWAVSKAFTNTEMLAQVEHDTEEFHRATQEQNGLKQQYIELLEAMGVPVTDELLGASGRRKLLQNPAARARAARQRAAAEAQVTPAQLVDALKTRLAAYYEYVAMKAQVASLARLYQATSPAFRLDMGTCAVTEKGGCIEMKSLDEHSRGGESSHCMWVALKDVKLTTLDWSLEPVDGAAPCPDYGTALSAHECLFSLVVNNKVYAANSRPDGVYVEANSRIDLYRDSKMDYQGNVKVCDAATDLVHEAADHMV